MPKGSEQKTLVIFGGTFDPPHIGHLRIFEALAARFGRENVHIHPTFDQPLKKIATPFEQRLQWCKLFFKTAVVSDFEREIQSTCTFDLLRAYRQKGIRPVFAMGSDQTRNLPLWKNFPEVLDLATWVVWQRVGDPEPVAWPLPGSEGRPLPEVIRHDAPAIRSTDLRTWAELGQFERCQGFVADEILQDLKRR